MRTATLAFVLRLLVWSLGSFVVGFVLSSSMRALETPRLPAAQAAIRPQTRSAGHWFVSDAGIMLKFIKPDRTEDFEAIINKLNEALTQSTDPERRQQALSWRVSGHSNQQPTATLCGALLQARLDQEEFPHITFGNGVRTCVRYFPDKLPIGVVDEGREHIFGYLVTRAAPVDFRAFLLRHAELLRALGRWTLRLWIPGHFREARAAYEWAWKQEFANPLRPSTADELRWYFGQRRGRHSAAHDDHERDLKRYAQARRAFSAPRYRVLYRAWLREGGRVIDATSSPALADAITRGAGRFEAHVLARPYLHLSSLVGTS